MQCGRPGREPEDMEPFTDVAHRLKPSLAVVLPHVFRHQRGAPVKTQRCSKGYAAVGEVLGVLGWVESDEHLSLLYPQQISTARELPTES